MDGRWTQARAEGQTDAEVEIVIYIGHFPLLTFNFLNENPQRGHSVFKNLKGFAIEYQFDLPFENRQCLHICFLPPDSRRFFTKGPSTYDIRILGR